MPHPTGIEIFCINKNQVDREAVRQWLDHMGATTYEIPEAATPSDAVVGLAAKLCYRSFEVGLNENVTRVRKDWVDYIDNILASEHGSVLHHASYTFAIEGLSRVCTAEMNRHSAGVGISEASMRYIRTSDLGYWLPLSIRKNDGDDPNTAVRKHRTREILDEAFAHAERLHKELCDLWHIDEVSFHEKKKLTSLFRRIIPMGVATGVVYTFNFRALRHIIALRSTPAAEEEIAYLAGAIAVHMCREEPNVFGDFEQDENGFWKPKYRKV